MFASSHLLLPLRNKFLSLAVSYCDTAPESTKPPQTDIKKWDNNWDLRENKGSKAVRQIVLIRHGQYVQGEKGDAAKVLTPLGREQAALTGKRLRELIDGKVIFPVRSVHYSTMARATETYSLIRPELPPIDDHQCQPCSMIREGAVCRPEPPSTQWCPSEETFVKNGLQVEAAFRNYVYRAGPKDIIFSEASDMKSSLSDGDVTKDAQKGESETPADNPNGNFSDIYVCHGNVIRYFVMRALQLPPEAWLRTAVYNASITVLHLHPSGRVSLYGMGDVGHLPPSKITYN